MTQKSRTLLLQTLVEKEACDEQLALFQEKFGMQVDITVALCVSVSEEFDFAWAAYHLLSRDALETYCELRRIAWDENTKARQVAFVKRMQEDRSEETARQEYVESWQDAWVKCTQKIAAAFAECYIDDRA